MSLLCYRWLLWLNSTYLGEQLLTEVNALLKSTPRRARASMFGVWHILFMYAPSSKPPSSAVRTFSIELRSCKLIELAPSQSQFPTNQTALCGVCVWSVVLLRGLLVVHQTNHRHIDWFQLPSNFALCCACTYIHSATYQLRNIFVRKKIWFRLNGINHTIFLRWLWFICDDDLFLLINETMKARAIAIRHPLCKTERNCQTRYRSDP